MDPGAGQPTVVPDPPKIRLPRLEKLPSTSLVVHGAPAALVASPGTLWVQQHRGYELTRVDPEQGKVVDSVNVGLLGCGDLAWAAGSVWESGCGITPGLVAGRRGDDRGRDTVSLQRPRVGVPGRRDLGDHPLRRVAELRRIDVTHVDEGRRVPVPGLLARRGRGRRSRLALGLGRERRDGLPGRPGLRGGGRGDPDAGAARHGQTCIEHDGAAWYVDPSLGVLVRVDPVDGSTRLLKVRMQRPSEIRALAASTAPGPPGRLWVRNGDKEVWLVDTRHDRVLRRIAVLDGGGGDVQQIGDTLWVAQFIRDRVERIPLG